VSQLPAEVPPSVLEKTRPGQLSPAEKALRRRNRRWLLVVAIPALIVGAVALLTSILASSSSPSVKPLSVPAGYKAVTDGYFGYAVPSTWSTNDLYTDDVGDLDTSGTTGWAAEHVDVRTTPPAPGERPPASFATFGQGRATPFAVGEPQPTKVAGAQVAYRYLITRPGFSAAAIDAWESSSGAELWMMVEGSPATTEAILSTVQAGSRR
jgi:hypothetical protein